MEHKGENEHWDPFSRIGTQRASDEIPARSAGLPAARYNLAGTEEEGSFADAVNGHHHCHAGLNPAR